MFVRSTPTPEGVATSGLIGEDLCLLRLSANIISSGKRAIGLIGLIGFEPGKLTDEYTLVCGSTAFPLVNYIGGCYEKSKKLFLVRNIMEI